MNISEFHFIRPYWLLALLPYFVLVFFLLRNKLAQGNWTAVCDEELLPYLLQHKSAEQHRLTLTAGVIAALLTIIALAGPTWERLPSPVFRNASALVIALDLSRSMDAADIKPSRLVMARYKIADILKRRKDGQTALLVYAGDAFTVTPLTDDTETIDSQLSALNTDIMPSKGSNTVAAIQKAVELFKQAGLQQGDILLVTDGVDSDKTLSTVESLDGYRLSIIGVGTAEGAPIALPNGGFLKDEQGAIVVPKLNTDELTRLARSGNGVYQTLAANNSDIKAILSDLDRPVQQQDQEDKNLLLDQWIDQGPWLLIAVLPLAAMVFRKGVLSFVLLLWLPFPNNSYALDWQDLWQTKNQQAEQAYKKQDYGQAAENFENPDWKAAAYYKAEEYDKAAEILENGKSAESAYNLGNALAKSGHLQEAIKAYEQAIAQNPANEDAKYNKEQVEKALEQQKQQEQQNNDRQQDKNDSEQNQDQNQSEQQQDQSDGEQKPEQKSEQKPSEQQSQQQNNEQNQKDEQQKSDQAEQEQAEQKQEQKKEQNRPVQQDETEPSDEQRQANEQWLKRIPDDPAGLLRRKFKYQYGQRGREAGSGNEAW